MIQLSFEQRAPDEFILSGELGHETVAEIEFSKKFKLNDVNRIIFDLSAISRVDTAGLAWLIHTLSELQQQNKHLTLRNIPEQLQKLMQLVQVSQLFE